ncbi:MAG TPA: hypothetical protein PK992_02675 [Planctomycetaceae bacterium]|nr:hypothetical protein [Planctomycetaceae bacterium]
MSSHSHPIYGLLKYISTLMLAGFAMVLFCTEVDETELKSWGTFAATLGVAEIVKSRFNKQKQQ